MVQGGIIVSNVPSDLKYSKEHEWVRVDGNRAYIGITDFAQSELGDIVFVELPEDGGEITANTTFGTVESVKTVSDLYAPVSGKIVEINAALNDAPEKVNESPYEDAWMLVVELTDTAELDNLLSADEYTALISK
ncbi:glycine cleavage system protein GcvH [Tumebacillus sp. BK434]|uniref:glycine cleavage system protein GcvH n=1 Tax=Tumebacillus sp. BK434 TaxID=2512169 RepID=UPI001051315F|nr:glycine cleavage system protein GcvH [Tumebacillus sp. BK434]